MVIVVGEYFYIARVVIICLCFSWGVYVILNDIIPPGCMGKIAVDLSDWLKALALSLKITGTLSVPELFKRSISLRHVF